MEEPRLFNKGMNMDLAVEFIPDGQYRYANNVRAGYSDGDSFGTIESALGNIEITDIDIPLNVGEVYKCIGQVQDKTANKVYYLLFNSAQNHRIMEYDVASASLITVMLDAALNFDPDFLITGINVIYLNPDTPLLYWTDGGAPNALPDPYAGSTVLENPPRMLNINKAKQYMLGNTNPVEAYVVIDVQTLDAIKWPSPLSPAIQVVNDTTYNKNNLKQREYQFKTAFGYDNNEQSVTSPISKVSVPIGDEFIGNTLVPTGSINNAIDVTFETGPEIVDKIFLYVRQSNIAENVVGDFFLEIVLDKYDRAGNILIASNTTTTYRFYNDKTLTAVNLKYSTLLSDKVPKTAKAQEYIDSNILVYGNTKEQMDLPIPEVTLTPIYTNVQLPFQPTAVVVSNVTASPIVTTTIRFGPAFPILGPATYYPVGTVFDFGAFYGQYTVTAADLGSWLAFTTAIGNYLISQGATSVSVGPGVNFITVVAPVANGSISVTSAASINKYPTLKSGATTPIGIVYYATGNRQTSVVRDPSMDVYVDFITERPYNPPEWPFRQVTLGWEVNHIPPIEATHWQWVMAPNSTVAKSIQFTVRDYATTTTQTLLSIESIIDYSNAYSNSILSYSFTSGDQLLLMFKTGVGVPPLYVNVTVQAFDEGTNVITVDKLPASVLPITDGSLVEIRTPRQQLSPDEVFYFEIGEVFEIGDAGLPTRYHKGQIQDQTPTQPATGVIVGGDTWLKDRQMTTTDATTFVTYDVEDFNFSDFYSSTIWNQGRPNIFDPNYSEVHLISKIPFSDVLIPNSQVNGLNRFYEDNYREYEQKYRSIQLLKNKQRRLVCFQELKTGIIPILARLSYDQSNNAILAETDQVLNPIEYYTRENGIGLNPESYAEKGDSFYFCDTIHGDILRSAQNGLTSISDYGLHNYITDLFGRIQRSGTKVNIFAVYNERFDQVEFCVEQTRIGKSDVLSAETFAFFEPDNYWASFYDYHPEMMAQTNSDIVTFKDGRVWLHNQGFTYANYYGVQYNSDIEVISNQGAKENKAYHSMSVDINQMPEVPTITTALGQLSNLSNFKISEGRYYKGFRRDLNTVGVTDPIANGNRLRGKWMSALIRIGSATYGRLFSVTFNWAQSPINNK